MTPGRLPRLRSLLGILGAIIVAGSSLAPAAAQDAGTAPGSRGAAEIEVPGPTIDGIPSVRPLGPLDARVGGPWVTWMPTGNSVALAWIVDRTVVPSDAVFSVWAITTRERRTVGELSVAEASESGVLSLTAPAGSAVGFVVEGTGTEFVYTSPPVAPSPRSRVVEGDRDGSPQVPMFPDGPSVMPGRIAVQFEPEVAGLLRDAIAIGTDVSELPWHPTVAEAASAHRVRAIEQMMPWRGSVDGEVADLFIVSFPFDEAPDEVARSFSGLDGVVSARVDGMVRAAQSSPSDPLATPGNLWGLYAVDAPAAWTETDGAGVTVAVIDTGVDATHPDLAGAILPGWNFTDGTADTSDCHGHGTHVAGTIAARRDNGVGIAGVAPGASVMPVKVFLGCTGVGPWGFVEKAIDFATASGVDVINMSLVGWDWGGPDSTPASDVEARINDAVSDDVVVVVAAGNESANACRFSPADVEGAITVSALTPSGTPASFSNYGSVVDVAAPGVDVLSTWPLGLTSEFFGTPGYEVLSGTSMAAPHVAGLVALARQRHPAWSAEHIASLVISTAIPDDPGAPWRGFSREEGHGAASFQAVDPTSQAPNVASIDFPRNCAVVSGSVDVIGTAYPHGELFVHAGVDPDWSNHTQLSSLGSPSQLLGTFNSFSVSDGWHTLSFDGGHSVLLPANPTAYLDDHNEILIDDVWLDEPLSGALIGSGGVTVTGRVPEGAAPWVLIAWELTWRELGTVNWQNLSGTPMSAATSPVGAGWWAGPMFQWDVTGLPQEVELRLAAIYGSTTATALVTKEDIHLVDVHASMLPGFPVAIPSTGALPHKAPKIADLDGDGSPELILGNVVLDSAGVLEQAWGFEPGAERSIPAIADIDGDPNTLEVIRVEFEPMANKSPSGYFGYEHVLVARDSSGAKLWGLSEPDADRVCERQFAAQCAGAQVTVYDLDGDGALEVLWIQGNALPDQWLPSAPSVLHVVDAGSGTLENTIPIGGVALGGATPVDVDGDGVFEVAVASDVGVAVWDVSVAGGSIVWQQLAALVPRNGSSPTELVLDGPGGAGAEPISGDFDLDGDFDDVRVGDHLFDQSGNALWGWPVVEDPWRVLTFGDRPVSAQSGSQAFYVDTCWPVHLVGGEPSRWVNEYQIGWPQHSRFGPYWPIAAIGGHTTSTGGSVIYDGSIERGDVPVWGTSGSLHALDSTVFADAAKSLPDWFEHYFGQAAPVVAQIDPRKGAAPSLIWPASVAGVDKSTGQIASYIAASYPDAVNSLFHTEFSDAAVFWGQSEWANWANKPAPFVGSALRVPTFRVYGLAVGDVDGDGLADLVATSDNWLEWSSGTAPLSEVRVYAWSLGVPLFPETAQWPMYRRDLANSGAITQDVVASLGCDPEPPIVQFVLLGGAIGLVLGGAIAVAVSRGRRRISPLVPVVLAGILGGIGGWVLTSSPDVEPGGWLSTDAPVEQIRSGTAPSTSSGPGTTTTAGTGPGPGTGDGASSIYEVAVAEFCVVDVAEDDILNLRTGPGIEFEDIGDVPYDAVGARSTGRAGLDRNGRAWFEVTYLDRAGWVASWHLAPEPCDAAAATTTTAGSTTTTVAPATTAGTTTTTAAPATTAGTTTTVAGPSPVEACLGYPEWSGSLDQFAEYLAGEGFNVIGGEDADEELVGTDGPDAIFALGGNDVIRGEGGPDCLFAGDGDDVVIGGDGADAVFGEGGSDSLDAGSDPHDYEHGGPGSDECVLFGRGADECES